MRKESFNIKIILSSLNVIKNMEIKCLHIYLSDMIIDNTYPLYVRVFYSFKGNNGKETYVYHKTLE